MTSNKRKFKCTKFEQDDFDKIKRTVARNTLLTYMYFNGVFKIHTNAREFQLGEIIRQKGKPIALYSRKNTNAQQRYVVTEGELLRIVVTL